MARLPPIPCQPLNGLLATPTVSCGSGNRHEHCGRSSMAARSESWTCGSGLAPGPDRIDTSDGGPTLRRTAFSLALEGTMHAIRTAAVSSLAFAALWLAGSAPLAQQSATTNEPTPQLERVKPAL